jgi:HlyD family secretion protein
MPHRLCLVASGRSEGKRRIEDSVGLHAGVTAHRGIFINDASSGATERSRDSLLEVICQMLKYLNIALTQMPPKLRPATARVLAKWRATKISWFASKIAWRFWILLLIVICIVGAVLWYGTRPAIHRSKFRSTPINRGNLIATVSATGTIEPEEVVDVGAQVGGIIKEFGTDPADKSKAIDYLSLVLEGTVLARIDDSVYRARLDKTTAQVSQIQAQLEQIRANIRSAEADVLQMKAKFHQADREWVRAQRLLPTTAITQADYDVAQANFEVAKANISVSEAGVDQARANLILTEKAVLVAEADRREAQRNMDYTVITSPVKGVIIDRRVNVGQTVVSSLNAPSLFLIAKDLKRLQVWASVNEADVGRLHSGQSVEFSVDAFPDERFTGQVSQIRLNATMTQNVVTYTVVITTDNSNGKLLPYLTANLEFDVGQRQNVLLIQNSALRWRPRSGQIVPELRSQAQASLGDELNKSSTSSKIRDKKSHDRGQVWVEHQGFVKPVEVHLGLSDGIQTEITGHELMEGELIVIGEEIAADTDESTSPFAPRMFSGGRR